VEEHFVSRLTEDELASVRGALAKLIPADDRPSEEACS